MNIKTLEVAGLKSALHGMRNPMNSWDKSDSQYDIYANELCDVLIGKNDIKLATNLVKAGGEHRKYLRQIQVWADFNMPRYWWSEFDTYHFNTKNSCSTMHTLMKTELSLDNFLFCNEETNMVLQIICRLQTIQMQYDSAQEHNDVELMNNCILRAKRILPEGFLQLRTVNTNYEELANIYHQRKNHRLKEEWVNTFCAWVETLPYFKELCILPLDKCQNL